MFPALSENDFVQHWDGWRRHDCEYIYAEGDLDSKRQCKRCRNLDKNTGRDGEQHDSGAESLLRHHT